MRYLCWTRKESPDALYPKKDARKRARIDEYLDWHHVGLRQASNRLVFLKYFSKPYKREVVLPSEKLEAQMAERRLEAGLEKLDRRLGQHQYVAGEKLTIADFAGLSDVFQLNFLIRFRIIIEPYKHVQRWYYQLIEEEAVRESHEVMFKLINHSYENHQDMLQ